MNESNWHVSADYSAMGAKIRNTPCLKADVNMSLFSFIFIAFSQRYRGVIMTKRKY